MATGSGSNLHNRLRLIQDRNPSKVLSQYLSGVSERVTRLDRSIGPDLDDQALKMLTIRTGSWFNDKVHLRYRIEEGINGDLTDIQTTIIVGQARTTTTFSGQLHLKHRIIIETTEVVLRIDNLHRARRINITCKDGTRAPLHQLHGNGTL